MISIFNILQENDSLSSTLDIDHQQMQNVLNNPNIIRVDPSIKSIYPNLFRRLKADEIENITKSPIAPYHKQILLNNIKYNPDYPGLNNRINAAFKEYNSWTPEQKQGSWWRELINSREDKLANAGYKVDKLSNFGDSVPMTLAKAAPLMIGTLMVKEMYDRFKNKMKQKQNIVRDIVSNTPNNI